MTTATDIFEWTDSLGHSVKEFVILSRQVITTSGVEQYDASDIAGSANPRILHYGLCELYDYVCKHYGDKYHFGLKFNQKGTAENLLYLPIEVSFPDTSYLQQHASNLIARIRSKIAENLIWKHTDQDNNLVCLDSEFPYMPRLEKEALMRLIQVTIQRHSHRSFYYANFRFNIEDHPHTVFWELVDPTTITD